MVLVHRSVDPILGRPPACVANSMSNQDRRSDKEGLIVAIEVAIEEILARDHGMDAVRVSLDRETGEIVTSQPVPDELKPSLLADAIRRAVARRVREVEREVRGPG